MPQNVDNGMFHNLLSIVQLSPADTHFLVRFKRLQLDVGVGLKSFFCERKSGIQLGCVLGCGGAGLALPKINGFAVVLADGGRIAKR